MCCAAFAYYVNVKVILQVSWNGYQRSPEALDNESHRDAVVALRHTVHHPRATGSAGLNRGTGGLLSWQCCAHHCANVSAFGYR